MITHYIKLNIVQQYHFITVILYNSNKMQLASLYNGKWNDSNMKHFTQQNNEETKLFYLLEKASFPFIILNQSSLFSNLHLL